ncbi:MAG: flagellar basal body rod protein FlgC [Myxococcota bacterium]|nr:flagellar basal body rod protein FlgC [Myxococcota bacterium]
MDFYSAMEIVSSGLTAERVRLNITASNLANAETTRTKEGGAYKRRDPIFTATNLDDDGGFRTHLEMATRGVEVTDVVKDQNPPRKIFDPKHPDADATGYVELPNVNLVEEMVNMIMATRAYEAGVTAMKSVKSMAEKALTIGR